MTVKVWTEQEPTGAAWTDCTWCSILMVIVGSGFTAFPLKAYTHAERHAFRAGDPRLNFAGGVDRAKARYSLTVNSPTPYSQSGLRTALSTPGRAYAVAGKLNGFPLGHRLRRFAPAFSGFHAVCVIPLGGGKVLWLDPLAPMGFAGDTVPVSDVTDIFCKPNYPNDARWMALAASELPDTGLGDDSVTETTIYVFVDGPRPCSIPAGGKVDGWNSQALVKTQTWPTGSSFPADALVSIKQNPQKAPNGTFYRCSAGVYAGLYIPNGQVSLGQPTNPPSGGFTNDDLDDAYNAGRSAVQAAAASVPPK